MGADRGLTPLPHGHPSTCAGKNAFFRAIIAPPLALLASAAMPR